MDSVDATSRLATAMQGHAVAFQAAQQRGDQMEMSRQLALYRQAEAMLGAVARKGASWWDSIAQAIDRNPAAFKTGLAVAGGLVALRLVTHQVRSITRGEGYAK